MDYGFFSLNKKTALNGTILTNGLTAIRHTNKLQRYIKALLFCKINLKLIICFELLSSRNKVIVILVSPISKYWPGI